VTTFTLTINAAAVQAELQRLQQRLGNLQPVMNEIGEGIVERAKARFASSTGPDGQAWAVNRPSTLAKVEARIGTSGRKKDGSLNARGLRTLASKRPLIGESHALETQIHHQASGNVVEVSATPVYAAMQQFGGTRADYPHLWGDIPARPFLPVHLDGSLYLDEEKLILDEVVRFLDTP
jgi:phage gpG-like protein